MRRVALSDNPVGRTVARAVRNGAGTVLLERGVVLDERIIGCLRSLGVASVYLQQERGDVDDTLEQAVRAEVAGREASRFGPCDGDPVREALRAAVVEAKTAQRLEALAAASATREDGTGDA